MSHSMILQDWVTIASGGSIQTIIQNEAGWIDVSAFQDACFYLQLGACTAATGTNVVTLNVQTAPTKDETFFGATASGTVPAIASFTLTNATGTGVQTLKISRWATETVQPLAKYLRWSCTFPALAVNLTFRIWVTLNQAGYA